MTGDKQPLFKTDVPFSQIHLYRPPTSSNLSFSIRPFNQICALQDITILIMRKNLSSRHSSNHFWKTYPSTVLELFKKGVKSTIDFCGKFGT